MTARAAFAIGFGIVAPAIAIAGVLFSRAYGELVASAEGRR